MKRKLRGFSLVEALVALVIASGALIGFYQSISIGFNLRDRIDSELASELLAVRILDRVGVEFPLHRSYEQSGLDGNLVWTLEISPNPPQGLAVPRLVGSNLRYITITTNIEESDTQVSRLVAIRHLGLAP